MWAKSGDLVKRFVNFLRVGRGIILTDRQEIFISHTFRLNVTNKGGQAYFHDTLCRVCLQTDVY